MSNSDPILQASHVSKSFGKKLILDDISLSVQPAETFGLLGPSGSGKTTLVRLLTGIDEVSKGEVKVLGTLMPKLAMMQKIGYMAQSDALYNELSALENMQLFASLYGIRGPVRKKRIQQVLDIVALGPHLNKRVDQFSGGMKRRLSLAIALLHEPPLLVLDEPTVGIDPLLRQSIWNELKALNAKGTTILLTTHVMDEASKCDRIGMLRDGKLLGVGAPEALIEQAGQQTIEEAFIYYGGGQA